MSEEKKSFISDVAGLSKPLTKLIDTLSKGTNIITTPWQTKRNAKADAQAIDTLTQSLNNVPGDITYTNPNFSITVKKDSIEMTAITQLIQTEVNRQVNLNEIVRKTALILEQKDDVSPEPVEEDWLNRYINIAKDITNEKMQNLWAQILAGEVEHPHSYSYRTLDFLKNLTSSEATVIQDIFKHTFAANGGIVYLFGGKKYLDSINIPFIYQLLLEELNLATFSLRLTINKHSEEYYRIANTTNFLKISNYSDKDIDFEVSKLSSLGGEILKLTPPQFDKNNLSSHLSFLNKQGIKYELIENVEFLDNGQIQWRDDAISIIEI